MKKAEYMRHILILSLALGISVSAFLAETLNALAAYSLTYSDIVITSNIGLYYRFPIVTGIDGVFTETDPSGLNNPRHYEFDYQIQGYVNSVNRYYLYGFNNVDVYLYIQMPNNLNFADVQNFNYSYIDTTPDTLYSVLSRNSVILVNSGFVFHFSLYLMCDNFDYDAGNPFNIGTIHLEWDATTPAAVTEFGISPYDYNGTSGVSMSSSNITRGTQPVDRGLLHIIAQAINTSTDINEIITLLTAISGYSEDVFNELTYIYNTNQNIYNRLGAILEFLQEWQLDSDDDMITILAELEQITTINENIISQLPSFSWDDYGHNISDYYQLWDQVIRPAGPTGRDTTLVWSWIGGTWPVYIIGLVLILGTISFVLYGKK